MRMFLRGLIVVLACLFAGQSFAADLMLHSASQCGSFRDSRLLSYAPSEAKQLVSEYFSEAKLAMVDPAVVGSRRPAYTWANEARLACGIALGYLKTGYLDEESVQKCDCFYQRFLAFR